jgi:hypothetical protein
MSDNVDRTTGSPILVDENEAGRLLGMCGKSVYNLRKSGQLPFVQLGKSIRYHVDSLAQFVKSLERRNPPSPGVA